MQAACGVVREHAGLARALARIDALRESIGPANALIAACLILTAALARTESRGAHFRSDFPDANAPQRTFLTRANALAASA